MKDKEIIIGNVVKNFPNLLHDDLHGRTFPHVSEFGDVNVCVREGQLPGGRIDLAWITETTIHLAELKRHDITIATVTQFRRYYGPVQTHYPDHRIFGYLIGNTCKHLAAVKEEIGSEAIRIMRLGIEIPMPGQVVRCRRCGAGLWAHRPTCPYCKAR